MDSKGRLAMPAVFRTGLGSVFYATVGIDHCIAIYTENEFGKLYERLLDYPDMKKNSRIVMQQIMGSARECEPDAQGRIMIPANLIKHAYLKKDCAIVGVGSHVEIWDGETWDKTKEDALERLSDIAENLPEIHQ
ncbi:MAG: division/cell wall cluster transcriptional repressor MraZ [Erysipelotrichales bacterium]|nr:division/cell wall cluster transcriptional repressor MraZ [Erysipelotrichales bacterium]MBQ2310778.1 division/cell wall cluster transcriptional repressor MraZ [Erysipelotrichales bacterium]MBQ2478232.1 division/cell wall cluster transcriptional repressor MraZ [Erysipelotrichales bacterium]MBQ4012062.1 division/cell wall cluster transcriptional repressor MraZ [Erysipelotrichales bacterium]MBQ4374355.1 division/cell wall cluster transcriptional repressor MraZ [Erysipelotrichales bacterium]